MFKWLRQALFKARSVRNVFMSREEELTQEQYVAAVGVCGRLLALIDEQNKEICLTAVRKHGRALRWVHEQDEEICMAAVSNDGAALRFVRRQTKEIVLAAVKQNKGRAAGYVEWSHLHCIWADQEQQDAG